MLKFRTYLFELILWVFIPTVIAYILFYVFSEYRFVSFPVIPATMIILGSVFYPILKKVPEVPENKRLFLFYGNIAIKMILSLAVILIVVLSDRNNALFFVITFFIFYILLMIFEVRCFTKIIKMSKT